MYGFGWIAFRWRIDPSIQYAHADVARAMIVFAPDIEARHFLDVGAIVNSDESPYPRRAYRGHVRARTGASAVHCSRVNYRPTRWH